MMLATASCSSTAGASIQPSRHTTTYTDTNKGWSWRYPSNWHLQRLSDDLGRGVLEGALVTNVDRVFQHPDCGSGCFDSGWDMHGTPDDLVVVQLQCLETGPLIRPSGKPDTPFPISLAGFKEVTDRTSYGAPEPRLWKSLRVHGGERFAAFVWFGDNVSPTERTAASRIVSSLTKPTGRCA